MSSRSIHAAHVAIARFGSKGVLAPAYPTKPIRVVVGVQSV